MRCKFTILTQNMTYLVHLVLYYITDYKYLDDFWLYIVLYIYIASNICHDTRFCFIYNYEPITTHD